MDNKLEYIQKTISNNQINNDSIMNFIKKYKIIYSKNQNGIFINLSKIDKPIIDILYEYIYDYINQNTTNNYDIDYYEKFSTDKIVQKKETIKYKTKTGLTEIEKQIINLSKNI
jgi:hypothetical protein